MKTYDERQEKYHSACIPLCGMRIAAAILASFVILLSTQPMPNFVKGSAGDGCMKTMSCCKKSPSKKSQQQNSDNGCKDMCNPFMPCAVCCYVVTEREALPITSLSKCIKAGRKPVTFISHYQSEFWHPPNAA